MPQLDIGIFFFELMFNFLFFWIFYFFFNKLIFPKINFSLKIRKNKVKNLHWKVLNYTNNNKIFIFIKQEFFKSIKNLSILFYLNLKKKNLINYYFIKKFYYIFILVFNNKKKNNFLKKKISLNFVLN